jgi:hypothetical protein
MHEGCNRGALCKLNGVGGPFFHSSMGSINRSGNTRSGQDGETSTSWHLVLHSSGQFLRNDHDPPTSFTAVYASAIAACSDSRVE